MSFDTEIENEIQAKGLTASRITHREIEANIVAEYYFTAKDGIVGCEGAPPSHSQLGLLTFCVLVLQNGFTVVGKSACASPENFDAELGRKIARQDAVDDIWTLMGYELRSKIVATTQKPPAQVIGTSGISART